MFGTRNGEMEGKRLKRASLINVYVIAVALAKLASVAMPHLCTCTLTLPQEGEVRMQ